MTRTRASHGIARLSPSLSKSRYISGLQCPKMLWWMVHEPNAAELHGDDGLQVKFARGHRVGELARARVPGGILVDVPHHELERRVAATANALAEGARAIYEASFFEDGIFVSVDILERQGRGFVLIEVKSTLDVKDEHLPDVAVQMHVVRRAGLSVRRAEVMHLNRKCRHPDLSNLFVRENVTPQLRTELRGVAGQAASMYSALFPAFEADAMAAMMEREPLGEDKVPDLILMNYKGADFVGHKYGPDSDELRVTLGEMDRQLKRMLSALEAKAAPRWRPSRSHSAPDGRRPGAGYPRAGACIRGSRRRQSSAASAARP